MSYDELLEKLRIKYVEEKDESKRKIIASLAKAIKSAKDRDNSDPDFVAIKTYIC